MWRAAKSMLRTMGLLLILAAALEIALHTFLNVWLAIALNNRPERFHLSHDLAWMVVPGEVHVRGLKIRQQGKRDQWILEVDRATVRIDVLTLLDRRFRITHAVASGAGFRWRARADVRQGPRSLGEPDIPGFTNPPDPTPEALYPPARPWRVELEDLDITNIREIWLDDFRYSGAARVQGSLTIQAHKWLEAESILLSVHQGQLTRDDESLVTGLHGEVAFDLVGSEPKEMVGRSLLGAMSGTVALQANIHGLEFLEYYMGGAPWLDLRGGQGAVELDLRMEDGAFRVGSRVLVEMADVVAGMQDHTVVGDGEVVVSVDDEEGFPQTTVRVDLLNVEIREEGGQLPLVQGPGFHLVATTPDVAMDRPFTSLRVELELPEAQIPEMSQYQAYLPQDLGLSVRSGSGTIEGWLRVWTEQGDCEGEVRLSGSQVEATLDALRMRADVKVVGRVVRGNLSSGEYDISGSSVELRQVRVLSGLDARDGKDDSRGWWAVMRLPQGSVAVGAPIFLKGRLELQTRDTVPFVTIFSARNHLPGWVRGLLNARPVRGTAWVSVGDHALRVSDLRLTAGKFEVLLELQRRRSTEGKLFARRGKLSVGMSLSKEKNRIRLIGSRKWYDAEPNPR